MSGFKIYTTIALFLLALSISSCRDQKNNEHAGHQEIKQPVYTCPMHPEIIRNEPGTCPICGMDLEKKEEEANTIQNVELEALLKPTNAFVVSSVPVISVEEKEENIELEVLGSVAYDTRQIGTISSRVSGRIEKLYVKYKYQRVQKGQKIMDLYSPELATAQQNLLFLLKNDADNTSLIIAAENRLLLLGFNRLQINQVVTSKKPLHSVSVYSNYSGFVTDLNNSNAKGNNMLAMPFDRQELSIKEGMYLQKGQAAFSIFNADKIWILLNIFPEQQSLIKIGHSVQIVPETGPHQNFQAKINYIEPIYREGSKTLTARVYVDNKKLQLPIGSRVRATISGITKEGLWLPKDAVLSLGKNHIVFVKESGGFRPRQITSGIEINNSILVMTGISATDSIAANAQFLVDNEAFIQVK